MLPGLFPFKGEFFKF